MLPFELGHLRKNISQTSSQSPPASMRARMELGESKTIIHMNTVHRMTEERGGAEEADGDRERDIADTQQQSQRQAHSVCRDCQRGSIFRYAVFVCVCVIA